MAESIFDLLSKPEIAVPHIIGRGVLPVKGKLIIAGVPKSNKSWVALNIAIGLASGKTPFPKLLSSEPHAFPVYEKNRVLYLEQEMGDQGLKDRFKAGLMTVEESLQLHEHFFFVPRDVRLRFDTQEGRDLIEAEIASVKPKVVFFDPMAKFHGADENDSSEMGNVLRFGDYLIEKYNTALVWLHHTSKPSDVNPRRGGDRLRGSSAIFADVDTVMLVDRKSPEDEPEPLLELGFELRRGEPLHKQYLKRLKSGRVFYVGEGVSGAAAARNA